MKNETITAPKGFQTGTAACGIKQGTTRDLGLLVAQTTCAASAVFTRNRFCGSPIVVGREHIRNGKLRAIVVNSGCANVATGKRGIADARKMCQFVADGLCIDAKNVLPSSTGIIGQYLPMNKVQHGIETALETLSSSATAGRRFAQAILTTDTKIKQAVERVRIGRSHVTVAGCCKGSGMIAPNMATMLAYVTTDADIQPRTLKQLLTAAVEPTFNRVTVDECQSTSDTVALLANGATATVSSQRELKTFAAALRAVCESLAYQIADDGEGATRVLEVTVSGAKTPADAHRAARAVATSPLVKTAIHGSDPNWGRIVQAIGATSVAFQPDRVTVRLNKTVIFAKGAPARNLDTKRLAKIVGQRHVPININLGAGKASDRVLTCDLSREYVTINADYHT